MSLRHALLGLLSDRPSSGYDLMKLFDTTLSNVWRATQSQVYGELTRMTDAGLVDVSAEGPRGRKEYSLRPEGRAELQHWLTTPAQPQPLRSEWMLRVFFLGFLPSEQAREQLARLAEEEDRQIAELERLLGSREWTGDPLSVSGRLVLEYGLRGSAMKREWARWALDQITAAR
ncbi:PadR family transcriptional regulator [Streptomyces sp. CB00455]|uniref:PadR family transcriptional regulator n=1 Tax=Streptomyces sp. CB00455 TaxID=1703927 RepID=UPI00093EDDA0|nr:PadR family transcriptional regulator [Streptomyces sp. CB00455]OKK16315.1 PadR family transcriptional regulator [Streptomyces sp. CB00455]